MTTLAEIVGETRLQVSKTLRQMENEGHISLAREKITYNTAHFPDWGDNAIYDKDKLTNLLDNNRDAKESFDYYCYLQFLLDKQLKEVTQYAHSKGVTLKGDIPIGINRDSIEAWTAPHLFNMDTQTGAPPDDF